MDNSIDLRINYDNQAESIMIIELLVSDGWIVEYSTTENYNPKYIHTHLTKPNKITK